MSDEQLTRTVELLPGAHLARLDPVSGVVSAWVLARYEPEEAWRFLQRALESDVADVQGGTTAEGIHLGAMAGTVDIVLRCLAGMRAARGGAAVRPGPAAPGQAAQASASTTGATGSTSRWPRTAWRSARGPARRRPSRSWSATRPSSSPRAPGTSSPWSSGHDRRRRAPPSTLPGWGRRRTRSRCAWTSTAPCARSSPTRRRPGRCLACRAARALAARHAAVALISGRP